MSNKPYGASAALVDIISAPGKAIDWLREHPGSVWLPLLILIGSSSALFAYYYHWVDMDWLIDQSLNAIPPEDRATAEPGVRAFMTPVALSAITFASTIFIVVIINALQGAYLHLMSKLSGAQGLRFMHWFSLSAWANFVGIIGILAGVLTLIMADNNQLGQEELMSLNANLLLGASPGDRWFTWATSLRPFTVWAVALIGLGYARWTHCSTGKAMVIAFAPWVLIYGGWAAVLLLRG